MRFFVLSYKMYGKSYIFFRSVNLLRTVEEMCFISCANCDPLLVATWELGVEKESEAYN